MINLLFSQPINFSFQIPEYITTTDSFRLIVRALDQNNNLVENFNEPGILLIQTPQYSDTIFVRPHRINFSNGIFDNFVQVTLASNQARFILYTPSLTDTSHFFSVLPGPFRKINLLLPGETPQPGTTTGKGGAPSPNIYVSSDTIYFIAYLADSFYNPVTIWDTVEFFASNFNGMNPFARFIPRKTILSGDMDTFRVSFRLIGINSKIIARAKINSTVQDSSSPVDVVQGDPRYLFPLLKGESILPGDTITTQTGQRHPGKTGQALPQRVDRPFLVEIFTVDACFNPLPTPSQLYGHLVDVIARDMYGNRVGTSTGPIELTSCPDSIELTIPFFGNYRIFVKDITDGTYDTPWYTFLRVLSTAESLRVWADPQVINADENSEIYAQVKTFLGNPIPGKTVDFRLRRGNGYIQPTRAVTNENGITFTTFNPTGFATGDTAVIVVTVDSLVDSVSVRVKGIKVSKGILTYPNPFIISIHEKMGITYPLIPARDRDLSKVKITIFTLFGEIVWEKIINRGEEGAIVGQNNTVFWRGKNKKGELVASGGYYVVVSLYRGNSIYHQFKMNFGVVR